MCIVGMCMDRTCMSSTSPFFEPGSTIIPTTPQSLVGDNSTQAVNASLSGVPHGQYYVPPGSPLTLPLTGWVTLVPTRDCGVVDSTVELGSKKGDVLEDDGGEKQGGIIPASR